MNLVAAFLSRSFSVIMTDRLLGCVVVEVLKALAAKTTNTLDDDLVAAVEKNLK